MYRSFISSPLNFDSSKFYCICIHKYCFFFRRTTCSACLNISECAWCENLRTCLPFSDYVSRHRHGQCTEWIDSEISNSNNPYTCRNCSSLKSCDICLQTFSCGWCGNRVNPTIGVCFEGDFDGTIICCCCNLENFCTYEATQDHFLSFIVGAW